MGIAAWSQFKFIKKNRRIRLGSVPHIDKEFFGTGRQFIENLSWIK